jgi:hypothetical protein
MLGFGCVHLGYVVDHACQILDLRLRQPADVEKGREGVCGRVAEGAYRERELSQMQYFYNTSGGYPH